MCVIFHGESWVLVPRTSPCPLEHINRKKKLCGKKRKKSYFPIVTYAHIVLLLLLFAGRGTAAGLFREQTASLPSLLLVTMGYRCRHKQKAYRWGEMGLGY